MNKSNAISRQEVLSNVYVVYGNNTALGDKIHTFLKECALRPITKEMASNLTGEGSPFVGRIIDVAFEHAQAVLVLLSGDEQVRLRKEWHKRQEELYEVRFSPQSMLEQIFEAGYAFGKYPERTILLQADNVRPFSDIAGREILPFTGKRDEYLRIKDRLSSIGCAIPTPVAPHSVTRIQGNAWTGGKTDPRRIFVVHGRNERLKAEVFKFLTMLNLLPISWGEAVSATNIGAPYTGKILEALLHEAQAVLVLLTGDDEVRGSANPFLNQNTGKKEILYLPRPNVVFEAGMSMSNTRLAERTILVQSGGVKIWDAIHGRHRIKLSDDMKHRWDLALSLQDAGCSVQIPSNELLRQIGNFGL